MSEIESRGRRVVAAVLSLLVPGVGHVYRGRLHRGLAWFGALGLLYVTFRWTGPLGFAAAMAGLFLAAPIDAALCRRGPPVPKEVQLVVAGGLLVGMIGLAFALRLLMVEAFKVPSAAMQPTLMVGDFFFIDKLATHPGRGDVVVFREPTHGRDFVKRVVAVGGDHVAVRGGMLYVGGAVVPRGPSEPCRADDQDDQTGAWSAEEVRCATESLGGHRYRVIVDEQEPGVHDFPPTADDDPSALRWRHGLGFAGEIVDGAYVVPAGHLFVMGDWRANSNDSRAWGPVPVSNVKGTAMFVWLSRGPDGVRWSRLGRAIE